MPLQAGRRGAAVDAGAGAWQGFHAAGQGGVDADLHAGRRRHDQGRRVGVGTGQERTDGAAVWLKPIATTEALLLGSGAAALRRLPKISHCTKTRQTASAMRSKVASNEPSLSRWNRHKYLANLWNLRPAKSGMKDRKSVV